MNQSVAVYNDWLTRRRSDKMWVEDDPAPLGLDVRDPRFSWVVSLRGRDRWQSAYRLLVATSPELLHVGKADMWDSGVVESKTSIQVYYAGKPLASNSTYYWKVRVCDESGKWGRWSKTAAFGTALYDESDWQAQWIGRGDPDEVVPDVSRYILRNLDPQVQAIEPDQRAPLFRKDFKLNKAVKRSRVYITGMGLYELHLNGQKVGDAVLTPNRTEFRKRILYDTYDITEMLKRGENAVGIFLGNGWFNGQKKYWGWQYQWYGSARALMQMEVEFNDGTITRVVTDNTWKSSWSPITFNCIYDGEDYDARLEQSGWTKAKFSDADWTSANVVPSPCGRLAANMAPSNRVIQEFAPVKMWEQSPGVFIFDMGVNFTGWVRLKVNGMRGETVQMRYAECLTPDGAIDTSTIGNARAALKYTLSGNGEETYEPRFTYCGFKYVEVTGYPGIPTLNSLTGCFVHADVAPAGEFGCSDPGIMHVHRCLVQSQRCNIQMGVPTDDTQRAERLGWGADAWASAPQAMNNFTMARLYRKWIGDFQDCQLPSGVTDMIVPRAGLEEDLVWSAAYLFIPLWQYGFTGDMRILEDHYESWERYLAYLKTQGHATFLQRPIGTDPLGFVDGWDDLPAGHIQRSQWGDHLAVAEGHEGRSGLPNSISTVFYIIIVQMMTEISVLLNHNERAEYYYDLGKEIREAYNTEFFNGKHYDNGEQSSQAWALHSGAVPTEDRENIIQQLIENLKEHNWHPTSGYPGLPFLLFTLMSYNLHQIIWKMAKLKDYPSWQFIVKDRTTIPEAWDGTGSWNHHALASPLDVWLYNSLAGVSPGSEPPGYTHVLITPYTPEDLKWARASIDTLHGKITSYWRRKGDKIYLTVSLPANTHATVTLCSKPKGYNSNMFEIGNGKYEFCYKEGKYYSIDI
ncbi:MAG: family 78 glycoside hydrolase catalytic domain [bacterium]